MVQHFLGRKKLWVSDRGDRMCRGLEARENMGKVLLISIYWWEYHLSIPIFLLLILILYNGQSHNASGCKKLAAVGCLQCTSFLPNQPLGKKYS